MHSSFSLLFHHLRPRRPVCPPSVILTQLVLFFIIPTLFSSSPLAVALPVSGAAVDRQPANPRPPPPPYPGSDTGDGVILEPLEFDADHPTCEGFVYDDMHENTHIGALLKLSSSTTPKSPPSFDDNHDDFDIFLRLAHAINLDTSLLSYETSPGPGLSGMSTLFAPRDIAIIQTAMDIHLVYPGLLPSFTQPEIKLGEEEDIDIMSEKQAYDVIMKFTHMFVYPQTVLIAIVRNHVTPAKMSLCEYVFSLSWTTWAGRNATIERNGLSLMPMMLASVYDDSSSSSTDGDAVEQKKDNMMSMFDPAHLLLNIVHPLRTRQGVVQHVDRLLIPDLSVYKLRATPSPSSSIPPPQPSPKAADTGASTSAGPSSSAQPSASTSLSAAPSTKTVPDIDTPVIIPFPSPTTPAPSPSPGQQQQGADPLTGSEPRSSECFPAEAEVTKCDGRKVRMHEVDIGDCVVVGRESNGEVSMSKVFAFSHRVRNSGIVKFIEIVTKTGETLTVSSKHYIPIVMLDKYEQGINPNNNNSNITELTFLLPSSSSSLSLSLASSTLSHSSSTTSASTWLLLPADAIKPHVMAVDTIANGLQSVTSTRLVYTHGLYAPHTAAGTVAVDGVVASCYTKAVQPAMAHALLAPVRWAWSVMAGERRISAAGGEGRLDLFGGWLDNGVEDLKRIVGLRMIMKMM